jgi:ACT domain-containing protein
MTSITVWGQIYWIFFHILAESIRDESFLNIKNQLFSFVKRICSLLPCPICSSHASAYLNKIDISTINTKYKFKLFIFHFHNHVNEHKKKTLFIEEDLVKYENQSLSRAIDIFIQHFSSKRDMTQLNQSFHRSRLIKELIFFFQNNSSQFQNK